MAKLTKAEAEQINQEIFKILTSDDEVEVYQKQIWEIEDVIKAFTDKEPTNEEK